MTESILNQIIGNNIKKYRMETNMYQYELAKKAGVSRSTIAVIESNNPHGISTYTLYKISRALNKKIDNFFI